MKKLLIAIILLCCCSVFGQNIEATTSDGKKVVLKPDKTWEYIVEKVKTEVKSSVKYEADHYEDVVAFSDSYIAETNKSEFETEAEYRIRLKKLVQEKQFNGKSIADICFNAKPGDFYYKAETKEFTVDYYGSEYSQYVDRKYSFFSIAVITFNFSLSPEIAKNVKSLIKFLIYGFPVEKTRRGIAIVPTRIIAINSETNEIYLDEKVSNFLDTVNTTNTTYTRPTITTTVPTTGSIRIVKAVSGDTVLKIAQRYGANAVEVANLNGMASINAPLAAGREIKIPVR